MSEVLGSKVVSPVIQIARAGSDNVRDATLDRAHLTGNSPRPFSYVPGSKPSAVLEFEDDNQPSTSGWSLDT